MWYRQTANVLTRGVDSRESVYYRGSENNDGSPHPPAPDRGRADLRSARQPAPIAPGAFSYERRFACARLVPGA